MIRLGFWTIESYTIETIIFFDLTPFFFIGQISLTLLPESKKLAEALVKSVGVISVRTTIDNS